ncbi:thiol-disulfide isomerase/thioredoxin [Chryseobacterium defluvii]|uniref:Thiol-disulfide isomerase/thioredoxin n=1 Tax=Chryseobacterium defluvii TaxID=160396 RepID=A0A840K882_9FLAO|nr:TlpA family protein disulfide reductase [Chryseobacterium defluvii]MBB4805426.1 thiol-disulfide isomerase/thioredoxin [Chryseobacterium defluvii]
MKKIILSMLIMAALSGCKKESTKTDDTVVFSDSVSTQEPSPAPVALNEFTPQKTSEFLKTKNDTLYVTNFFATWCGPCVREIPHFKEKMEELKNQPVKFTFISLDSKEDWATKVSSFADEQGIRSNTVLLDGSMLDENFFTSNFKTWDGSSIPFTFMKKGDKTQEFVGMIDQSMLEKEIERLKK